MSEQKKLRRLLAKGGPFDWFWITTLEDDEEIVIRIDGAAHVYRVVGDNLEYVGLREEDDE